MEGYRPPLDDKVANLRDFRPEKLFDPWSQVVVPPFPVDVLPPVVARFVCSQAELIGADISGIAMSCLAVMGGALDHQFRLRIMRNSSWSASPRLWVVLVGDPSTKKTPAINAATHELEVAQGQAYDAWSQELAKFTADGGKEEDGPPRPPRHVISDITSEKLAEILGRQSRGILAKRDEISGWLASMERYSGRGAASADRAFWLQAYDGGRYTVDRIGRGEKHVANLSVSLIGGIQPAKLAEMKDQTSDGLLQRFLPVLLQPARFPVDKPAGDTEAAYGRLIRRLLALEPTGLAMDDAAVVEMEKLRRHVFDVEQASGGLAPGFQAFCGKLAGMAASVALILHLAEMPNAREALVGLETVLKVRRIIEDCVLPHAFESYRGTETVTEGDRLQKVASYVITSRKERIRMSDFASNVALCKGARLSEIIDVISPLVAAGWLTPESGDPLARVWKVEPLVHQQFAERRRVEEQRKEALATLMGSARKGSPR